MSSKSIMGFDLDKLIVGGVAVATAAGAVYVLVQGQVSESPAPMDPSVVAARLAPIGRVDLTPPPAPPATAAPQAAAAPKPETAKAEPAPPAVEAPKATAAAPAEPAKTEAAKPETAQPAAAAVKAEPAQAAAAAPKPAVEATKPAAAPAPTIVLPSAPSQTSTIGTWKPRSGMPWTPGGNPIGHPVEKR